MASFSSSAFSTNAFSTSAFDFGGVTPPIVSGGFKGAKRLKERKEHKPDTRRAEFRYGVHNDYGLDSLEQAPKPKVEKKKAKKVVLASFQELAAREVDLAGFANTSAQMQKILDDSMTAELLKIQQLEMMQEQEDEELLMLMMMVT